MSTAERQPLSEAVTGPQPKTPLGPPHDAWATLALTVSFTATMFFLGWSRTAPEWISSTGLGVSVVLLGAAGIYFIRAYGFGPASLYEKSSGLPVFAYLGVFFGMFGLTNYAVPAIHQQFADGALGGLLFTYFTIALLTVSPMRLALGQAPARTGTVHADRSEPTDAHQAPE